ncbi:hypothetical protein LG299_12550 [Microbacterium lacus]|uniref:hypothetical protein n=1 Tax=Microbacterium lacus TaxID=415217 RepID=UPI00384EA297
MTASRAQRLFASAERRFDESPETGQCTAYLAGIGDVVVEHGSETRRIDPDQFRTADELANAMVTAARELLDAAWRADLAADAATDRAEGNGAGGWFGRGREGDSDGDGWW